MAIRISTTSGCTVEHADERLRKFLRAEWPYYDGIEDPQPDQITVIDLLAPVMVNAYGGAGADRLHGIHEGLVKWVEPMLAHIPTDADLRDHDLGSPQVRELLEAAVSIPGVLVPVATKILHRKRRRLIPMLDNVVLAHYLKVRAPEKLARTQDKARAGQVAVEVLDMFREDLVACHEPLSALSSMASDEGRPVTPLRILELLIWSEVEPRGYYRV